MKVGYNSLNSFRGDVRNCHTMNVLGKSQMMTLISCAHKTSCTHLDNCDNPNNMPKSSKLTPMFKVLALSRI